MPGKKRCLVGGVDLDNGVQAVSVHTEPAHAVVLDIKIDGIIGIGP